MQYILRGADGARAIGYRNAGTVHAGQISCTAHRIDPCADISSLLRQKPAAFFLVEKDHGPCRKTFAPRGSGGGLAVDFADSRRFVTFQLRIDTPIEQK